LPQVDFPTVLVTATLAGASAETMATSVATPLERRPVRREDPALLAFRDWLLSEAERQSRVEAELVARPARPASRKQASTQSSRRRKRQPNLMQVSRARRPPPRRG
jgi:hypothetical protein